MHGRLRLYSMREVERLTGVNRTRLAGLVEGLGIPTYAGPGGSLAVDDAGLEVIRHHLAKLTPQPATIT